MTIAKLDNNPNWLDVINEQTVLIQKFDYISKDEFERQRSLGLFFQTVSGTDASIQYFAAHEKRMEAYFKTNQFDLATNDANHILSFEPQNELALKIIAKTNNTNLPKMSYSKFLNNSMDVEETKNPLIEKNDSNDMELDTYQSSKRSNPYLAQKPTKLTYKKPCITNSPLKEHVTVKKDTLNEMSPTFWEDLTVLPLTFENHSEQQLNQNYSVLNNSSWENLTVLPLTFENYSEQQLNQHDSVLNNSILVTDNPFFQDPSFTTLILENYPELQLNLNFLQQNPMDTNGQMQFIINMTSGNGTANTLEKEKKYKNPTKNVLFDLTRRNDLSRIKEQFKDIAVVNAGKNYTTPVMETLFLEAVKNNSRDTAHFFGLPKVRLLQRKPTSEEAKQILVHEIYIYKDITSREFVVGFKALDGLAYQKSIHFSWNKTITDHLNKCNFNNQLYLDEPLKSVKTLKKLLIDIHNDEGNLPFRIFSSTKFSVLEEAITCALQNNEINFDLLFDLMKYASLHQDYPRFDYSCNNFDINYTHFLQCLFIWAIKQEHLDLILLLTQSLFVQRINEVLPSALTMSVKNNKLPITHYLLFNTQFTSELLIDLFWDAYDTANQDHLQYFLALKELMDLVDASLLNNNVFTFDLDEYKYKIQSQFIFAALEQGKITNFDNILNCCLDTSNYPEIQWELIEWFAKNPSFNPGYWKLPLPENAISLAINTQDSRLLISVLNKYTFKKEWFNQLPINTLNLRFLDTMLNQHYSSHSSTFKSGIVGTIIPNSVPDIKHTALICLSEYLYVHPESRTERMLFNFLLQHCKPAALFNAMLKQKWYRAPLDALVDNAYLLKPEDLVLGSLNNHPAKNNIIKDLLNEPSIYNKLTPPEWLDRIHLNGLDSYELRFEICKKDFYRDFLKIWMVKSYIDSVMDFNMFVPTEVWHFIASFIFLDKTHLLETSIKAYEESSELDVNLIKGRDQDIALVYRNNQVDLFFKNQENELQSIENAQFRNNGWQLSFFKNSPQPLNTTLYSASSALKQEIVDMVKEHKGHVPDIRNSK